MTRARQPRAVTAWALLNTSDGYIYAPTCDWTRRDVLRHTDGREDLKPIRVRIVPLPAKDATSEGVATGPGWTASPSGARKEANLSEPRYITQEQMATMACPFPPEPGYEGETLACGHPLSELAYRCGKCHPENEARPVTDFAETRTAALQEAARMAREEAAKQTGQDCLHTGDVLHALADKLTALAASGAGESEHGDVAQPASTARQSGPLASASPDAGSNPAVPASPAAEREARRKRALAFAVERAWRPNFGGHIDMLANFAEAELARERRQSCRHLYTIRWASEVSCQDCGARLRSGEWVRP